MMLFPCPRLWFEGASLSRRRSLPLVGVPICLVFDYPLRDFENSVPSEAFGKSAVALQSVPTACCAASSKVFPSACVSGVVPLVTVHLSNRTLVLLYSSSYVLWLREYVRCYDYFWRSNLRHVLAVEGILALRLAFTAKYRAEDFYGGVTITEKKTDATANWALGNNFILWTREKIMWR